MKGLSTCQTYLKEKLKLFWCLRRRLARQSLRCLSRKKSLESETLRGSDNSSTSISLKRASRDFPVKLIRLIGNLLMHPLWRIAATTTSDLTYKLLTSTTRSLRNKIIKLVGLRVKLAEKAAKRSKDLKAQSRSWILNLFKKINKSSVSNSGRSVTNIYLRTKFSKTQSRSTALRQRLLKKKIIKRWWMPLTKLLKLFKTC